MSEDLPISIFVKPARKTNVLFLYIPQLNTGERLSKLVISTMLRTCIVEVFKIHRFLISARISPFDQECHQQCHIHKVDNCQGCLQSVSWSSLFTFIRHCGINIYNSADVDPSVKVNDSRFKKMKKKCYMQWVVDLRTSLPHDMMARQHFGLAISHDS